MTFFTFVLITALIAFVSWLKTKGEDNSSQGYFLAGRGLSATVIGFSMVLTCLSEAAVWSLPLWGRGWLHTHAETSASGDLLE